MAIKKNGYIVDSIDLKEMFKTEYVYSDNVKRPEMIVFNNTDKAIMMLYKHIMNKSRIGLHTDVDMDGVGCTYIMKSVLNSFGCNNLIPMMNSNKEHGLKIDSVDKLNNLGLDLLVVTDSSTNNVEEIKNMGCDVLVIDHHDVKINCFSGKCNDSVHDYVIVNNNIENSDFEIIKCWLDKINNLAFNNVVNCTGIPNMSCGLVVYELMRIMCTAFNNEKLLEEKLLYQWVGITLFTDAIDLKCERNQWYIKNTVQCKERERTINTIMAIIAKYKFNTGSSVDKSFITYTFAPIINKSIRANAGSKALDIILNRPNDILELKEYEEVQENAINKVLYTDVKNKVKRKFVGNVIFVDTNGKIPKTYNGVIAGKIVGNENKNCVVYSVIDGYAKGSFRGRYQGIDYRKFFDNYSETSSGDGHDTAFGFRCLPDELPTIMNSLHSIEPLELKKPLISLGRDYNGIYHADTVADITKNFGLMMISIGNSRVTSDDEVRISISKNDIQDIGMCGKVYNYDVLGIQCKAFSDILADDNNGLYIYSEYSKDMVNYIK